MNRLFKQITALACAAALTLSLSATAFAAGTLDHFQTVRTYENQFSDIGDWYESYVVTGYELGLFDGVESDCFSPNSSMTVGEAIKLAACLHSIYHTGSAQFEQSTPWWDCYERYCLQAGIMDAAYGDHSNAISRAEFAQLLAKALPDEALTPMNSVAAESIPDVRLSDPFGPAVYKLYRAGILTGSDKDGTFHPDTNIRRSEMAAILTRMIHVASRCSVTLGQTDGAVLTAEQLFARCSPAVFSIETRDEEGTPQGRGSGVFLSANGEAVTSWHVLDGAAAASVTTADGKTYEISGVYDYDIENDLVRIQVDGSGFTPMQVNYSGALHTGAQIYTIGNPRNLEHTLSAGIISAAQRTVNGVPFIQFTAPISSGSSGGALINDRGELIGITAASVTDGQNLNLANPIEKLLSLSCGESCSVGAMSESFYKELAAGFTLSETELTLQPEDTQVITCAVPGIPSGYALSYEIEDTGVVRCSWGEWVKEGEAEDTVELTLSAKGSGETEVTISLRNRSETVLATQVIHVTVSE